MRAGVVVGVITGLVVLGGCGSSESSTEASRSSSPTTTATKPSVPIDQLLLTEADFPAGVQMQKLGKDEIARALGDLSAAGAGTEVDPAACGPKQEELGKAGAALADKTALTAAVDMNSGVSYISGVIDATRDLDAVAAGTLGLCAHTTSRTTLDDTTYQTEVDAVDHPVPPGLAAEKAMAYQVTTATALPDGSTQTMSGITGFATVRGLTVTMRVQSLSSDQVDGAMFDTLFTAAARKVQDAG